MDTIYETLTLFVEKANEMRASGLWQRYYAEGQEFRFSFGVNLATQQLIATDFVGPDADTLAALLLPLRMFLQSKDRVSFQQLKALLRRNPTSVSLGTRRKILSQLTESKRRLDAPVLDTTDALCVPEVLVGTRQHALTQGEVLETFLYGHYAHVDQVLRSQYLRWKHSPRFAFFEFVFVSVVSDLLCTTLNVANLLGGELSPIH